jgi:hypothetical protein
MILKIIFAIFSLLLLIYLILPGPTSINNFPPLPKSVKSTLSGDTWQVPNVAGYFSDNYRAFATDFYKKSYQKNTLFPFPPLRLNYPPEFAYTAIKDQTQGTYLEEFTYPLRDSLFVNGLEPYYENGQPKFQGSTPFETENGVYKTKVTLRYYPSPFIVKIIVWLGIITSIYLLYKLGRKIIIYG